MQARQSWRVNAAAGSDQPGLGSGQRMRPVKEVRHSTLFIGPPLRRLLHQNATLALYLYHRATSRIHGCRDLISSSDCAYTDPANMLSKLQPHSKGNREGIGSTLSKAATDASSSICETFSNQDQPRAMCVELNLFAADEHTPGVIGGCLQEKVPTLGGRLRPCRCQIAF